MRPRVLLTPVLAGLLIGGCGGTTATTTTVTSSRPGAAGGRGAYVAHADALCKSADGRQAALRAKARGLPVAKLVPILRQQATIAQALSTELGKLTPPPGDAVTVGRFVRAVHQLAVYSTAVANSIQANHAFAARALAGKLAAARQQETLLGQGYGYKICSSGKSY